MAGTILSQATFGTMTECMEARDVTLNQGNKDVAIVCSYPPADFAEFFKNFNDMIKELHKREENHAEWKPHGFEGNSKCGGLAVEPNEWIGKDMTTPYEPLC
jgi:hypothetical protein